MSYDPLSPQEILARYRDGDVTPVPVQQIVMDLGVDLVFVPGGGCYIENSEYGFQMNIDSLWDASEQRIAMARMLEYVLFNPNAYTHRFNAYTKGGGAITDFMVDLLVPDDVIAPLVPPGIPGKRFIRTMANVFCVHEQVVNARLKRLAQTNPT